MSTLHSLATRALPADALCGLDESEGTSVDRIARAVEASGYGEATAHRTAILRAIGEHLRAQYTDAREALRYLAGLDRRLAVWGACVCAREALRFVPEGEERPLLAIETTERWIAGQATLDDVQRAWAGARAAWRGSAADAAASSSAYATVRAAAVAATDYARADAADAAAYARAAAYATADAAAYAAACATATAARRSAAAWKAARNAELRRLVGVIADALPGLPPEVIA